MKLWEWWVSLFAGEDEGYDPQDPTTYPMDECPSCGRPGTPTGDPRIWECGAAPWRCHVETYNPYTGDLRLKL